MIFKDGCIGVFRQPKVAYGAMMVWLMARTNNLPVMFILLYSNNRMVME
jgi:hypothetical protein